MNTASSSLAPVYEGAFVSFLTLLKKEIKRFLRVWTQTVLSPVINSTLYILVFGISLSAVLEKQHGFSYLEFLVPGLIAMSALNNSLQNSASSVMISKFHNDLQDLKVIPLSSVLITSAYSIAGLVRGMTCGLMVFIVGQLFIFFRTGEFLVVAHPFAFIAFLVLGCLIFGSLGIWAGFIATNFDQVSAISQFIILPLIYLGGVFYSLKSLHPLWQNIALGNPLVYIINGIRWSVLGVSDIAPEVSFAFCILAVSICLFFAWRGVRYGNYFRF